MKRKLFRLLPLMVAAVLFMVSCSSKDEGTFIPKSASFVCHIDVASLWEKGDLANADNLKMVQSMRQHLKSEDPEFDLLVGAILKDPNSCGIDFRQPVCYFEEVINPEYFWISNDVISAKMNSRSDFDKFIANLTKDRNEAIIHCDTLGMTAFYFTDYMMVAYNDNQLFIISDQAAMINDLVDETEAMPDAQQYLAKLLNLKKDESMASNKNFDKYLDDRKDISVFMNYSNLIDDKNPFYGMLAKLYKEEDLKQLKESSVCIFGSFEKGCIELYSKTYGMPEVLAQFGNKTFNEKLLGYLPAQTLAAFTIGVDVDAIAEYLNASDEVNLDDPLGIKDYTINDLLKALDGSIAASFYGMQEGMPYFAVAADLNNNQVIRDILNEIAVNNGNVYTFDFFPMQLVVNDNVALLSTDPAVIANAQAGGKSNGLMAVADKAKKGNFFYMDLNLQDWPTELLALIGLNNNPIANAIFAMFDRLEFETEHDGMNSKGALYLSNKDINSLAYILQEVDKMN